MTTEQTTTKETRPLFTEEDKKRLEELPVVERWVFNNRFSDIAMRRRLADDTWETTMDQIEKDANQLIRDLKSRLNCPEAKQQHPTRKDFEDAGVLPRQDEG